MEKKQREFEVKVEGKEMNEEENKGVKLEEFMQGDVSSIKAEIVSIEIVKAFEVFGDKSFNPDKPILRIGIKGSSVPLHISMPQGLELRGEEFYVIDALAYRRSIINPMSKWREFTERNGIPKVGKVIDIDIRGNALR